MTPDLIMTDTDTFISGLEGSGCLGTSQHDLILLFLGKKGSLHVMLRRVNFSKAERK